MNQISVQHCIEALCQKGCREVLETIRKLENKSSVDETTGMNEEEIQAVLKELKSIMAIYEA